MLDKPDLLPQSPHFSLVSCFSACFCNFLQSVLCLGQSFFWQSLEQSFHKLLSSLFFLSPFSSLFSSFLSFPVLFTTPPSILLFPIYKKTKREGKNKCTNHRLFTSTHLLIYSSSNLLILFVPSYNTCEKRKVGKSRMEKEERGRHTINQATTTTSAQFSTIFCPRGWRHLSSTTHFALLHFLLKILQLLFFSLLLIHFSR